ncbi:hypothetical protein K440DRAFT_19144 [Wilcoxina mikolae CBS 423.85]|nr:hypothetical protein K440DRAFT_19144 [Wilcoxina mikolae CBS 423.85]
MANFASKKKKPMSRLCHQVWHTTKNRLLGAAVASCITLSAYRKNIVTRLMLPLIGPNFSLCISRSPRTHMFHTLPPDSRLYSTTFHTASPRRACNCEMDVITHCNQWELQFFGDLINLRRDGGLLWLLKYLYSRDRDKCMEFIHEPLKFLR